MKLKQYLAVILGCGVAGAAWGQQNAGSGPSLAATMQFLQATLNGQGKMDWTTRFHDNANGTNWTYTFSGEVGNVVADPASGRISYHFKGTRDGALFANQDLSFGLHDVKDLTLTTGDLRQKKNDLEAGHPTWDARVDPLIFDLVVRGAGNSEYYFFFGDEDTANRVAKAFGRAVELCGGSRGSF